MGLPMTPRPMNPICSGTPDPFSKSDRRRSYLFSSSCLRVFVIASVPVNLTDKVALITGGKRIGLVVAGDLAARGVDVALSYARSQAEAERAADIARSAGRRAATFNADLSQPAAAAT